MINPDMQLHDLDAAAPLNISYLPGTGDTLVVSFAGVGTQRHGPIPHEFYALASDKMTNHVLFISDASRSWLNGPGLADRIVTAVETCVEVMNIKRVVALGNSMGGSMALILAELTRVDAVIAVVPQYSAHPRHVPEETRWTHFRDKISQWPFEAIKTLPTDKTDVLILHGTTADERIHLDRFPVDPACRHYVFENMDHRLAQRLHKGGKLQPIVAAAIAGRPRMLRHALATAGGVRRADALTCAA